MGSAPRDAVCLPLVAFWSLGLGQCGLFCSISEAEPLGCAWKSGEDREARVRGGTVLTVWGTRVESLFSEESVGVRLEGPVVLAGSLPLSGGVWWGAEQSARHMSRMLGPGALGSGSSQAPVEQAWLNACVPVCLANCGHGVFPLEAQVDGCEGHGPPWGAVPWPCWL